MKLSQRIICSILIVATLVCMFLPIATSVDNRAQQLQKDIRKEENGLNREANAMTRANDKVEAAAIVVTDEDKEMQSQIDTAESKRVAIEAVLSSMKEIVASEEMTATDEAFVTKVNGLKTELESVLKTVTEGKDKLASELSAIQSSRAFIDPVAEVDEQGIPVNLLDVLLAEYEANPDVFKNCSEIKVKNSFYNVKDSFDKWLDFLKERYPQLQQERRSYYMYDGDGRILPEVQERYDLGDNADKPLSQDERDLIKSIRDTDLFVVTMIKIIRQQVAINEMAADPNSDSDLVKTLQDAQDKVYKELCDVNNKQDEVAQIMEESEAALAGDPIPTVYYSLLPNGLPVPDNSSVQIAADIKEVETEIKSLQAEIAPLDEILQHATTDGVKAVEDGKAAAEGNKQLLGDELKALQDAVAAAEAELALYSEGMPVATEDEAKNSENAKAKTDEAAALKKCIELLEDLLGKAEKLLAQDETLKDQLDPVIAAATQLKDDLAAKLEAAKAELSELDVLLADYNGRVATFEEGKTGYAEKVDAAKKLVEEKQAEIDKVVAEIVAAEELLAQITGDNLTKNQEKHAELNEQLAEAQLRLEYLTTEQAAQKLFLQLPENELQVDMQIVNSWGALYPTHFADFTVATWLAFALLLIALVLLWIPMGKLVSKCYTFSSFANLAAVLVLAYALLRLSALPIAQPYSNPIINAYVAIPMLVLPLIALLLHSSAVLNTKRTMIYVLCIALCVLSLLPFWLMIVNATRNTQEIQQGVSLIPSSFLKNNWNILQAKHFDVILGFKNSAIIAFGSTLLSVYFSALTAYGLTVYRFKGSKFLYAVILAIIMIPGQVTGTGFFMFMYQLEWTNSYLPLIIPAIASASTVFFFKQYLEANFQVSLVEAARIDGAGEFYTYNRIVLPIMVPAMATMGIMAVIGSWNNYLTPLMLLSKSEMKTLPMMVKELRGDIYRTEYGSIYLGLTLTALPLLIVYFLFSKYIIAGVAVGGVKE